MLRIESKDKNSEKKQVGILNLIDLAGSERLNKTNSTGSVLLETKHINKSLSTLGDVINSIVLKKSHIPFRDSKLTYILEKSFSGSSKCVMFVNISPNIDSLNETLSSLRFAEKVKKVELKKN
jgi:kinesin family member C1